VAAISLPRLVPKDPEQARTLVLVLGVLAAIGAFVALLTAPAQALLGDSAHAVSSGLHGVSAGVFTITATIGLYQGYRLFLGKQDVAELQILSLTSSAVSAMTIIFGNWIYIPYRGTGGPREYFIQVAPEIHKIFFEFKEFVALFTLPLIVAVTVISFYYGQELNDRPRLRTVVSITLALVFFYFFVTFGLGAAITKLRPV
jgi:hypothetical protein